MIDQHLKKPLTGISLRSVLLTDPNFLSDYEKKGRVKESGLRGTLGHNEPNLIYNRAKKLWLRLPHYRPLHTP